LSKVLPTSRGEDTLVDRFVRGNALPVLFDRCVAVVGALPVDESVVELMFSAEKTIHRKNESREQTSHELQFQQNTVALLRSERALMSATSKNKGNHSTLAQVHKAGEQMLASVGKYTPAQMSDLGGRRTFHGSLKGSDVKQAEAAVKKKRTERAKQGARKAPTEAALRQRQRAFSSVPTKHEKELAIIAAVADHERRGAVVSEVKFKGQVGVATQFYSTYKAAVQRRLLQASLPLSFVFALKIISWRAQSEQKRKHSSATTVLWLVRSARDALLRGEVHEYLTKKEKAMLSAMRLGVLRTTEGIAEVDEAVRARSTKLK
jgi:hypothetical protein